LQQRQQPGSDQLVGQLVHREGDFNPLGREHGRGGSGTLLAGIQHQAIQGLPLIQQLLAGALHARQIRQIHGDAGDLTGRRSGSSQLLLRLIGSLGRATEQRELMATASETPSRFQADARTAACDQESSHHTTTSTVLP
jgi:hypothetical protein